MELQEKFQKESQKRSKKKSSQELSKWYIVPTWIVLILTTIYPVVFGVFISLFDWNWGTRFEFVGWGNYQKLFNEEVFRTILYNTFRFSIIACAVEFFFGLYLAVQVHKLKIPTGLLRGLLMTPLMISGIIVALMSKVLFDPYIGVYSYALHWFDIYDFPFYGSTSTAMGTIIAVDVWWQSAFIFIIALAGIQSVPSEVIDAARVDGISEFRIFWHIKFPYIKNLLIAIIIFRFIDVLKIFDLVFGTTGGGPNLSTEVFQTYAYRTAFKFHEIGYAMSVVVVFSVMMLLVSFVLSKFRVKE